MKKNKKKRGRRSFYWRMIFLIFSLVNIVFAVPVLIITFFSSLTSDFTFFANHYHSFCERELWGWIFTQVLILLLIDCTILCCIKLKRVTLFVQSLYLLFLLIWTIFGIVLNALEKNCTLTVLHIFVIMNIVYNLIFIISSVFALAFYHGVVSSRQIMLQNISNLTNKREENKKKSGGKRFDVVEELVENVDDNNLMGLFRDYDGEKEFRKGIDTTSSSSSTDDDSDAYFDLFGERRPKKWKKGGQSYPIDTPINIDEIELKRIEESEEDDEEDVVVEDEGEFDDPNPLDVDSGGVQISFEEEFPDLADKYREIMKEQAMMNKKHN